MPSCSGARCRTKRCARSPRWVRARFHAPNACTYLLMRNHQHDECLRGAVRLLRLLHASRPGGRIRPQPGAGLRQDRRTARPRGDLAGFNGGFNPQLSLDYYCDLVRAIRARYGDRIELYAFTIAEFLYLADHASLSYTATAERLKQAGVRWITGGGSEILTEDFRLRHSKFKVHRGAVLAAQAAIVATGLRTTATMVIGFDESIEERIEHLDRTRRFQDETGAQESFLCWNFKPWATPSATSSTISRSRQPNICAISR